MKYYISVVDNTGADVHPAIALMLRRAVVFSLQEEGIFEPACVDITLTDNEGIRRLNHLHRGIDRVTDVLSFPLGEDGAFDRDPGGRGILLGDIVISQQRAREQAREYGHSFTREMGFLAVHSMFHLLGYDHELGEEQRLVMRRKEEAVLERLCLTR